MPIGSSLYNLAGWRNQARIDQCRYALGLLPRVDREPEHVGLPPYPDSYRGCVLFSADLELAWGWRKAKGRADPLHHAVRLVQQTRRNSERLLALFAHYGVPVTWATVGHLFLGSCSSRDGRTHPEMPRLPHFEGPYWRHLAGDWFEGDPGTDSQADPAWYAPDLIHSILQSQQGHEIACHTFSHIDCSDAHCPPEVMDGELDACCRLASEWGLTLRSFVFPGNLPGNIASLKRWGFTAYRCHDGHELGFPSVDAFGLWRLPGGVQCERRAGWSSQAWVGALQRCVDRALQTGAVAHFWFHPSCDPANLDEVFPALLDYVAARRRDLWLTTMGELASHLSATCEDGTGPRVGAAEARIGR